MSWNGAEMGEIILGNCSDIFTRNVYGKCLAESKLKWVCSSFMHAVFNHYCVGSCTLRVSRTFPGLIGTTLFMEMKTLIHFRGGIVFGGFVNLII